MSADGARALPRQFLLLLLADKQNKNVADEARRRSFARRPTQVEHRPNVGGWRRSAEVCIAKTRHHRLVSADGHRRRLFKVGDSTAVAQSLQSQATPWRLLAAIARNKRRRRPPAVVICGGDDDARALDASSLAVFISFFFVYCRLSFLDERQHSPSLKIAARQFGCEGGKGRSLHPRETRAQTSYRAFIRPNARAQTLGSLQIMPPLPPPLPSLCKTAIERRPN